MTNVQIHLACNNPDNGNMQWYVESININIGSFEPALMLTGSRLAVGRWSNCSHWRLGHLSSLKVLSYSRWVGNWCWDMVVVSQKDAAKIVNYLKKRGWCCEGGWAEMDEKWDNDYVFAADDFVEVSE